MFRIGQVDWIRKTLTQMFDSDVRVAMTLLEEIRKIKNKWT